MAAVWVLAAVLMAEMMQDNRIRRRQGDCDRLYAAMAAP